jgi:choline monooxygenase
MHKNYSVDADITTASTIDSDFYHDESTFALARERVFARSWQWIGDLGDLAAPCTLSPRELLPGLLHEPLLLVNDKQNTLRCLSNVCSHRGNLLITEACKSEQIRCRYHSRRFDLAGNMTFMPEFSATKNFPSARDNLPHIPFGHWSGHGFAAIDPAVPLDAFLTDMSARLSWLPVVDGRLDSGRSRDYVIDAHWALYVENYLEGFHIPFVHAGLNDVVDVNNYTSELFRYSNLQLALARDGEPAFEPPTGSRDAGQRVAAYYWWIFPNMMFNFYPWGLSLNIVMPEAINRTRIAFRSYVWDESQLNKGAGAALHQVEMEDEAIVEAVHRGTRSRFYGTGRYSPTREQGTHHFHQLLCEFMRESQSAETSATTSKT